MKKMIIAALFTFSLSTWTTTAPARTTAGQDTATTSSTRRAEKNSRSTKLRTVSTQETRQAQASQQRVETVPVAPSSGCCSNPNCQKNR